MQHKLLLQKERALFRMTTHRVEVGIPWRAPNAENTLNCIL